MNQIDERILRELDHQKVGVSNYTFILNKLDSMDKKFEFLNYLSKNRNVMLKSSEIMLKLNNLS